MLYEIHELNERLSANDSPIIVASTANGELQEQLSDELSLLKHNAINKMTRLSDDVAQSEGYNIVQKAIIENRVLDDDDPIWESIISSINTIAPNFITSLKRLSGGSLTTQDYHLAVLILMDISSTNIAKLLGRVKSTITYRRKQLCTKLFLDKVEQSDLDAIIRSL